ncbi:phosphotransferase [Glaciihabitans sp. INWT7]|uniref:phosphotransferase n=1 Tax=Glaciihabitans sp. INWT7 TaxID=2596912 RepID=UPI00162A0A8B|nr:phosphotransferase [Glaciihabitans sp. INWT7]QNE48417.1 phosphotransferase [Glaciihabitans sp. INWT7]
MVPDGGVRARRYLDDGRGAVVELPAGDVTVGVIRIGETVRRPHQRQSWAVASYLDHLASVGFTIDGSPASPRFLGLDAEGRDTLTFIPGDVAEAVLEPWVLTDALLESVAVLVTALHRASAGFEPVAEPFPAREIAQDPFELVTHLDVTPQNVVVRDGRAIGLVDFDLAGPSTRFTDSVNAAMHWVPLRDPVDLPASSRGLDQLARLKIFADASDWTVAERRSCARFAADRAALSWRRMRLRAESGGGWARLWQEGVGDVIERRRLWLLDRETAIVNTLLSPV